MSQQQRREFIQFALQFCAFTDSAMPGLPAVFSILAALVACSARPAHAQIPFSLVVLEIVPGDFCPLVNGLPTPVC
jgi:hypothetical protein